MEFFLKMQGRQVLNLVEFGWGSSLKLNEIGRSTGELKHKQEWDKLDNEDSDANAQSLYNIFNGDTLDEFRRIVTCKWVKEPGIFSH